MEKECPCGVVMDVKPYLIERKKYCSKVCHYKYHGRRSGLTYKLVKENPTSFKKGFTPWNKGVHLGEKSPAWKGDKVGYDALHEWVERWKGKPSKCDFCGTTESKRFDWSNISGEYKRDLSDWQRLCVICHPRYDYEKFGARKEFYER
jgi:hypothetical protein